MIISHGHRFIFIKTNKTGGTSFELALAKICAPEDIITPVSREDEKTRRALGLPGPQNYRLSWHDVGYGRALAALVTGRARYDLQYYNHISAREIRARIGKDRWNSYFKFCFERNPWDRVVSLYHWKFRHQGGPRPSLSEFVHSDALQVLKRRGRGLYTIDGEIAVDRICRFENLAGELESLRRQFGVDGPLELPRAKSQHRRDTRAPGDVLTGKDRQRIAEVFREEIELMGYGLEA